MSKNIQANESSNDSMQQTKPITPQVVYKTSKLSWLISLLAIAGVAGVGFEGVYGSYGVLQQQKNLQVQQQRIDELVNSNQQLQLKLESAIAAQSKISSSISTLTPSQTSIVLTQLNGLVNGAVQSLVVYHDVVGSIKLLSSAEQVLVTTNDPLFSELKIALTKNLASLNAQNDVDLTMTLAKISAIADLAKNLQTTQVIAINHPIVKSSLWDKFLDNIKQQLSSLVTIRKVNVNGVVENANVNNQKLAMQQIQLNVLSLRQALITHNAILWNSSLNDLSRLIDSYYIHDDNAQKVLSMINQLKSVNFQENSLNIDDSVQALSKANQMYFGK